MTIDPAYGAILAAENEIEFLDYLGTSPLATQQADDTVRWAITGVEDNTHNGVTHTQLNPEQADVTISAMLRRFADRKIWFQWYITPECQPHDLEAQLLSKGCLRLDGGNIMYADLDHLVEVQKSISPVTIQRVIDEDQMRQWHRIFQYDSGEDDQQRLALYISLLHSKRLRWYVALLEDQPVAVSMLFLGQRAAGLLNVATLRSFQRRGFGTAVTLHALREARAEGYQVAVLAPSPDGYHLYTRLGFELHPSVSVSYFLEVNGDV